MPGVQRRDGLTDENVAQVYNLVASAQTLQADSYLTLVDDFETLVAALSAGVRYFSGEAIGETLPLPAPAQSLSLADIKSRFEPPEEGQGLVVAAPGAQVEPQIAIGRGQGRVGGQGGLEVGAGPVGGAESASP